jgi:RNA polymerase sigma factor (sigma-70 family)
MEYDWTTTMERSFPAACRRIARRIPPELRSRVDAEDIVMDAIVGLLASAAGDDSTGYAVGPLTAMARKRLIDCHRARSSLKRRVEGDWPDRFEPVGRVPAPEESLLIEELFEGIAAGRSPGEREAIRLRLGGHSNAEIAAATGWNLRKVQRFFAESGPLRSLSSRFS